MQGAVEERQLPTSLVMLRNISIEESESITVGASSALIFSLFYIAVIYVFVLNNCKNVNVKIVDLNVNNLLAK